ncbi:hypothetical protein F5887DRAFT_916106 [Amanita rubescens]|nr:hypothetical protein F5887DRAFT_916106 [Amanita rubescens]
MSDLRVWLRLGSGSLNLHWLLLLLLRKTLVLRHMISLRHSCSLKLPAAVAAAEDDQDTPDDTLAKALVLPEADTLASITPNDTLGPAVAVAVAVAVVPEAVFAAEDELGPELELEPVVKVEAQPQQDTESHCKVHPHSQQRPFEEGYDTFPEESTHVPRASSGAAEATASSYSKILEEWIASSPHQRDERRALSRSRRTTETDYLGVSTDPLSLAFQKSRFCFQLQRVIVMQWALVRIDRNARRAELRRHGHGCWGLDPW